MNVEVDVTQYVEDILSDISCWISISLFNNLSCDLLCWCTVVISGGNLGLPCSFTIAIVRKLLVIHISFFSFSFLFLVIYFQERGGPGELGCVITTFRWHSWFKVFQSEHVPFVFQDIFAAIF